MDLAKNFAKGTLAATIDEDDTSLTVETGQGALFPTAPFNATIYNSTDYPDPSDDPDREIVRVTAISTDTLTITRAQEGTTGNPHDAGGKTYQIVAGLTARMLNEDLLGDRFGSGTRLTVDRTTDNISIVQAAARKILLDQDQILVQAQMLFLGDQEGNGNSTYIEIDDGLQRIIVYKQPVFPNLPTSNPAIAGALWNDSGTVKVSAG